MVLHQATYSLGSGELRPDQRVVFATRPDIEEAARVALHLGLSPDHPRLILEHVLHADGEYLGTLQTKRSLGNGNQYVRFRANYGTEESPEWGHGLRGMTAYIVDTLSNRFSVQDLVTRVGLLAQTAKYNGADNVVVLSYTLPYAAQERGIHDTDHPRMQTKKAKENYDGQGVSLNFVLKTWLNAGVDAVVTAHLHATNEARNITERLNKEYSPLARQAAQNNSNQRYTLNLFNISVAPLVGVFLADKGEEILSLNTQDKGRKIIVLGADVNATPFAQEIVVNAGWDNATYGGMNKTRGAGGAVETLGLDKLVGPDGKEITGEVNLDGFDVLVVDDMIRQGGTMQKNNEVIIGSTVDGLTRDARITGRPNRVVVYATRSRLSETARTVLSAPAVNDIVLTGLDARVTHNIGQLGRKTILLWSNFLFGTAAKAIERGEDPATVLTPDYIRNNNLLDYHIPRSHRKRTDFKPGII
ncbi:hypothetical protein HYV86_00650 [Candidatus Woesearchaeota archaeon]|nr:hypothetical protein [Candidatus Woesearchaeota archaeon]